MSIAPHTTADGFITSDDTDFLAKTAQAFSLAAPDMSPRLFHSGGGNFGIQITCSNSTLLLWGDCDGYWAADIEGANGEISDGIETDHVFNPLEDVRQVADWLLAKSQEKAAKPA